MDTEVLTPGGPTSNCWDLTYFFIYFFMNLEITRRYRA